jgi:hypothetical protein
MRCSLSLSVNAPQSFSYLLSSPVLLVVMWLYSAFHCAPLPSSCRKTTRGTNRPEAIVLSCIYGNGVGILQVLSGILNMTMQYGTLLLSPACIHHSSFFCLHADPACVIDWDNSTLIQPQNAGSRALMLCNICMLSVNGYNIVRRLT